MSSKEMSTTEQSHPQEKRKTSTSNLITGPQVKIRAEAFMEMLETRAS